MLEGTGVWSASLRYADPAEIIGAASELEQLGYTALWIPDSGGPIYESLDRLLGATSTVTVATGILNIWTQTAPEVVAWWDGLAEHHRSRMLLGLGVSHAALIGETWGRPIAVMNAFLDELDGSGPPKEQLCVAALGPRMLELSRRRTSGACPYLTTPEHTAQARALLGDAGLYVEQGVVLETDPQKAREVARAGLDVYCSLPNYTNNWKRLGFTDDDVATRSDRLVDALIAWGDVDSIHARVEAHRQAGADHVCIQVIAPQGAPPSREAWRSLAPR